MKTGASVKRLFVVFLQVSRFHVRNQLLREVIQFDGQYTQVVYQPIVGKHRWDGDQQARHRRNERCRHAWGHRRQVRLALHGDVTKGAHHPPNSAQKAQKGRSADRNGQPNEPGFQLQGLLGKPVQSGVFGADMKVSLVNDGPVTILIDTKNRV